MEKRPTSPFDSSNDAEIIILDASAAEVDNMRRPITGERLKALQEELARRAEAAKLADEYRSKLANGEIKLPPGCIVIDADVVILDESTGITDRTRRPLTGKALEDAKKYLAQRAESQRLNKEDQKKLDAEKRADGDEQR